MKSIILHILFTLIFVIFFQTSAKDLYITEIMPNPAGTDTDGEYIEIYNDSDNPYKISDILLDGNQIRLRNSSDIAVVQPKSFLIVHDDNFDIKTYFPGDYARGVVTSTSFSNSGDTVRISDLTNTLDELTYTSSIESIPLVRPFLECSTLVENLDAGDTILNLDDTTLYSPSMFDVNNCVQIYVFNEGNWSEILEVEDYNVIVLKIELPESLFELNSIRWDIDGDYFEGSIIEFNSSPDKIHNVRLELEDMNGLITQIENVTVKNIKALVDDGSSGGDTESEGTLRLNELYPNPTDSIEWVEIHNYGTTAIDLADWKLTDFSENSTVFTTKIIDPGEFIVVQGDELSISLNNSGDTINLINPAGETVDSFKYLSSKESESWAYENKIWYETSTITKGFVNTITQAPQTTPSPTPTPTSTKSPTKSPSPTPTPSLLLIKDTKTKEIGTKIKTRGVISVNPNVLGQNIFYIQDDSAGIKIKTNSEINISDLKENYEITVVGELGKSVEEFYLKVENQNDITLNSTFKEYSYAQVKDNNYNFDNNEGKLIELAGAISSLDGANFYVKSYGQEFRIYGQNNLSLTNTDKKVGDDVIVRGILSQYKTTSTKGDGYRVLPRKDEDIKIYKLTEKEKSDLNPDLIEEVKAAPPMSTKLVSSQTNTDNPNNFTNFEIPENRLDSDIEEEKIDDTVEEKVESPDPLYHIKYAGMFAISLIGLWYIPESKEYIIGLFNYLKELYQKQFK